MHIFTSKHFFTEKYLLTLIFCEQLELAIINLPSLRSKEYYNIWFNMKGYYGFQKENIHNSHHKNISNYQQYEL